jgi:hypothetical protein
VGLGRNHTAGFFWPYFYTSNCSFTLGSPPGNGDGDAQNVMLPASPTGMKIDPLTSPWGLKVPHLHPLMEEIPVGDQGSGPHCHPYSSPPARGCPTCRVREPARAASRGDPTEGELPRPQSLANGTEPHLANPRKRFNGRVSGPRSLPLSNGAWASTRTTH